MDCLGSHCHCRFIDRIRFESADASSHRSLAQRLVRVRGRSGGDARALLRTGLGAPGLGIAVAFPIAILSPGEKGSPLRGRERSGEVDQLINYLYDDLRCHLWAACACAQVSTYV